MPWSNQNGGGGPWGGGGGGNNQGPWGQGPNRPRGGGGGGGGNGGPPDLEDILRRSQDRLKGFMPGGFNGGAVAVVFLAVLAFLAFESIYTVQPDERGVELRFGKPKEELSMPGLHFHLWPFETVEIVKVTEQQQNIGARSSATNSNAGWMLTGDQNIVNVQFSVLFTVTDPRAYLFNVEAPAQTLQQVADSAMREVVGRRPAQDIFRDAREGMSTQVRDIIQGTMDRYGAGIAINAVPIEDAAPPREVADAFEEVQRAEQDEDRIVEEANRYANQKLGGARGQAAQVREEASAYRDQTVNEAQGEAQRFVSIYDQYVNAPDVTRERIFIETMENVLKNSNKVIIEQGQNVVPYLPLNEINRPAAAQGGN
ncbi:MULTISPECIES: FtsH protease activity modulator HflK [Rhizobium/Agrobacterium group]|jgi:membrane protease subunit HflK|uniref:Protein HflK n=1 Tax=Rhizobium soli TaxID=424798 RepID=A0A7X0JGM6_9HYPH|nr:MULTISPECIES: FtsH protease activity modulator HflK [Rhizobium/Agrobacterium group]RYE69427.1 MAG: FtsH protease activity modulator HflK [Rhizobiaceae bacterium]KQQ36838.1 phage tail protein [Rhizobium sp. Leaf306]MBB6506910.1 membrane protease subunit HflK [Rhizobium soli]MBD8650683.1 FtsH protease activity modulator HflK [Rhizobium sp. CFBP 13726]MBP2461411.1 membrane protease subunit HflK [Rhizobium sp. PvP014]